MGTCVLALILRCQRIPALAAALTHASLSDRNHTDFPGFNVCEGDGCAAGFWELVALPTALYTAHLAYYFVVTGVVKRKKLDVCFAGSF